VLLAARATWSQDGHLIEVVSPSPEFAETVALMGCPTLAVAPVQD
jgi:anti-anti-sigma regulatory factor